MNNNDLAKELRKIASRIAAIGTPEEERVEREKELKDPFMQGLRERMDPKMRGLRERMREAPPVRLTQEGLLDLWAEKGAYMEDIADNPKVQAVVERLLKALVQTEGDLKLRISELKERGGGRFKVTNGFVDMLTLKGGLEEVEDLITTCKSYLAKVNGGYNYFEDLLTLLFDKPSRLFKKNKGARSRQGAIYAAGSSSQEVLICREQLAPIAEYF